ncbi:MAG TPA: hypothetical protein VF041_14805 [Gemmatimonadaceae bacterium]
MSFRDFRRRHPGYVSAIVTIIVGLLALDGWLAYKRVTYEREIARLHSGMSDFERKRTDAILSSRERRFGMMMQLLRRQARWDKEIHLSVSVDSARMYLERDGALLREIPVEMGPERRIGVPPDTVVLAVPRGTRSVRAVLHATDDWEVPEWVYRDRGIPVPADRKVKGALGPVAIVLDGGTVVYSLPEAGPLNDSGYVLPGSVRARAEDLEAVVPNLGKGTAVYFY